MTFPGRISSVGPAGYTRRRMSVEDNIAVVRQLGEAMMRGDWAAFGDLIAENCEWTDVPSGRTIHGVAELVDLCRTFVAAFPDFSIRSRTVIGRDDLVAYEWSAHGTHTGPLTRPDGDAVQPTGRPFTRTGVAIVELRDGKIVRYRDYFDRLTLTEQLGIDM